MLSAGYVTLTKEVPPAASIKLSCEVRIPNTEVKATHEDLIIGWFEDKVGMRRYADMINSLFYGEIEAFAAELNRYLQEATSVRNVGPYRAEQFYQGFMLGLLIVMRKEFSINTEVESGQGYADALIIPKNKQLPAAVVFEYKVGKDPKELSAKVSEALEQLETKNYLARVQQYAHIDQVAKVGIAFYGKEALVQREMVNVR